MEPSQIVGMLAGYVERDFSTCLVRGCREPRVSDGLCAEHLDDDGDDGPIGGVDDDY